MPLLKKKNSNIIPNNNNNCFRRQHRRSVDQKKVNIPQNISLVNSNNKGNINNENNLNIESKDNEIEKIFENSKNNDMYKIKLKSCKEVRIKSPISIYKND